MLWYQPPVFAQLADLIDDHAFLDLVQRHRGGAAQFWVAAPEGCQIQHALCEGQHQVQVAQGIRMLSLAEKQGQKQLWFSGVCHRKQDAGSVRWILSSP